MAISDDFILSFNKGVVSPLARARADIDRVGVSAETQMNWMPRALGSMMLRPGLQFISEMANPIGAVKLIPFVYSYTDRALIAVTSQYLTFYSEVGGLITRPSVSTTVTNPEFTTDVTGWTDADQAGATSAWDSGGDGRMVLTGTGTTKAIRHQQLTIAGGDQNVEHALRIDVDAGGGVTLRIGTTLGADNLVTETVLTQGNHSIAFTPTGAAVYVYFYNRTAVPAYVTKCDIEPAGQLEITSNLLPIETFDNVRYAQSGDVVFVARGNDYPPVKFERRAQRSWSVAAYVPIDGPYRAQNITPITLTASALTGAITVTASEPYFQSGNVNSLFEMETIGQTRTATLGALNAVTDYIRVTGITESRIFDIDIDFATGSLSGTVVLEQSVGEPGNWSAIASYTTDTNTTYDDGLDNQIVYYRLRVSAYTSGSGTGTLAIATGSVRGVFQILTVTNETTVSAVVLKPLGSTSATTLWSESAWSSRRGYPSAVEIHQGRLWWAGKDKVWGSIVDDFYSFDPTVEGDSGTINRSIGKGPVDTINWLKSVRRLIMGTAGAEFAIRSTEFEEAITPTNMNMRDESTWGSRPVDPQRVDDNVVFIDRTGARALQLEDSSQGMTTLELTLLCPEILQPNVVRTAVQRRPDTRVHMVRCDGTAVVMVYDKLENVKAFVTVETEGLIEDVAVLPNTPEDAVFYVVVRTVGGVAKRFLELWAREDEAEGGTVNIIADSARFYDGVSTSTITGLSNLSGKDVVVWGNGKPLGTYTVSAGGSITLSESVTYAVIGLSYYSMYKSGKLEFLTQGAKALTRENRLLSARLLLRKTHKDSLEYGQDEAYLDSLPPVEEEAAVATNYLWETYDTDQITLNGTHNTDARLVLKATAPMPCTVLAAVLSVENNDSIRGS